MPKRPLTRLGQKALKTPSGKKAYVSGPHGLSAPARKGPRKRGG